MTQINLSMKQKKTHNIENRLVIAKGEGKCGRMDGEFAVSRCKLLSIEWINTKVLLYSTGSKDLLYSTGNSAQCYVAAWLGEERGGEWIHVYVWLWLSGFALHLKLSHC